MSGVRNLSISAVGLLAILCCASFNNPRALTAPVNQSAQADNGQPMQALVSEVRELRLAIQRSNLSSYHAQVTLERLRLQQPRVDRLSDKLEKVRSEIALIKARQAKAPEDTRYLENELGKEKDPAKRRSLEESLQLIKRYPEQLAECQEEETQLIAQLQPEQAKLSELNGRLDALQKELEALDKPQPGGKQQ
jgi:chromosome segregation ATPase